MKNNFGLQIWGESSYGGEDSCKYTVRDASGVEISPEYVSWTMAKRIRKVYIAYLKGKIGAGERDKYMEQIASNFCIW